MMNDFNEKTICFITGASGVGKTTLVSGLKKKYSGMAWSFLHFDSIGVPSIAEMRRSYGSPADWQKVKTWEWIARLVNGNNDTKVFLEGQVNLHFIRSGFQKYHFENYEIILIDCSEDVMSYRILHKRCQPELLTDEMKNWLRFLETRPENLRCLLSIQVIYHPMRSWKNLKGQLVYSLRNSCLNKVVLHLSTYLFTGAGVIGFLPNIISKVCPA